MRRFPTPLLFALTACGGIEGTLAGGDGTWQIAEYRLTIRDASTGEVRFEETLAYAGSIRFVTEYDDWGGQYAIMELPTPRPLYPSATVYGPDAVPTELWPNTRYVLWDTGKDGRLKFAWGSGWSEPEELPLERDGDGYSGSSTIDFDFDIASTETWEQRYVLVP
ncbi:MAG: hypothetical protein KC912_24370 [Proteobacteria bacterium]|nr:hypothetical protein [Pseudomonadota bacterium]